MTINRLYPWKKGATLLLAAAIVTSCQNQNSQSPCAKAKKCTAQVQDPMNPVGKITPLASLQMMQRQGAQHCPSFFSMPKLMALMQQGEIDKASRYVNIALNAAPTSAFLHMVNGLVYQEGANQGRQGHAELAMVAFRTARDRDQSNWLCAYLLGVSHLKTGAYYQATQALADAAILNARRPEIWHDLSCASYYVGDLPVAYQAAKKAYALDPKHPQIVRCLSIVAASVRDYALAQKCVQSYANLVPKGEPDVIMVQQRINDWQNFYHQAPRLTRVGDLAAGRGGQERSELQEERISKEQSQDKIQIVFDVVLLRTLQGFSYSKGSNLFSPSSPLAITFGPGNYSVSRTDSRQVNSGQDAPWQSTMSRVGQYGISGSLPYFLNIANSGTQALEVYTRAQVATTLNKKAMYVEGDQFTGATAGSSLSGSSITSVDAGIKLELLPKAVDEKTGTVVVEVALTSSHLMVPPNVGRSASDQLFSSNQSVLKSTFSIKMGQTAFLGGIFQVGNSLNETGLPLAKNIPILQYFVSNKTTNSNMRSAMFLMTPQLGGVTHKQPTAQQRLRVAHKLAKRGLLSLLETNTLQMTLRAIAHNRIFPNLRSGDIPGPLMGMHTGSFKNKLDQLNQFLWW